RLIRRLGGTVTEAAFIICLPDLGGIERLEKEGIHSFTLVNFPGH
ncbi:adenine phosphoribosyltransferase, partial [Providencia rettgeri]